MSNDYLRLMIQSDNQARQNFQFDPRIALARAGFSSNVQAFNATKPTNNQQFDPSEYTNFVTGSRADPEAVQTAPKTVSVKRYVIIDTSQRDWVRQPNPYANLVFSFGSQAISPSNPPVYANNPFVPTFAVEQSNLPQPIPGIPNTQGWTLAGVPSNVVYPAYNSSLPKGNFIAFDTGYTVQPSGSGFGSVFTPCNVQAIRLIRAVLPQRQFLNIPIVPGDLDSSAVQANLVGKSYSTFTTYPYLMLYLNEYFGQYVGGNEPMRRSFSVMTQKQRQQTRFDVELGVQQYDYEAWGVEALQFQSPLTNLQRLAITVTDPIGNTFTQSDSLSVALIQAVGSNMYLACFTPSLQYFSSNELRLGDRVVFYPETISNMLKSSTLGALDPQKKNFLLGLLNTTFPVLELLDYVTDSNGLYVPRNTSNARTTPYIASYNGFLIPNFITTGTAGTATPTYPGSIDPVTNTVLEPNVLVGSNLPFLNVTLQPVYTLELDIAQPDTGSIGGTIVL
jgi:hypothetical protein